MHATLRNGIRTLALASGLWLGAATGTALAQNWIGPRVAQAEDLDGGCRMEVRGNGRFYRLAVLGLGPGQPGSLFIANEDTRPIDRVVRADNGGRWAEFYMPFLPNHEGGTVRIAFDATGCELDASFPWSRPSASIEERSQAALSIPRSLSLR